MRRTSRTLRFAIGLTVAALTLPVLARPSEATAPPAARTPIVEALRTTAFTGGAPSGIARKGNQLYVSDQNAAVIRRLTLAADGVTVTSDTVVAGTGTTCADPGAAQCGDGGPATSAQLIGPAFLALDSTGLFFAGGGSGVIRKLWLSGPNAGTVTRIAGNYGDFCFDSTTACGDGGAATSAKIGLVVTSLATNASGQLFFADALLNRIRCVGCAGAGVVSTVAGSGKVIGTGPGKTTTASPDGTVATAADLIGPMGVAIDPVSNELVFVDGCNWMAVVSLLGAGSDPPVSYCDGRVRKVVGSGPNAGRITTIAGVAGNIAVTPGNWAKTRPAGTPLRGPVTLGFDAGGSLLVGETGADLRTVLEITTGAGPATLANLRPGVRRIRFAADRAATTIEPAAGGRVATSTMRNARNPLAAVVGAGQIATSTGSAFYFADQLAGQVRRVGPPTLGTLQAVGIGTATLQLPWVVLRKGNVAYVSDFQNFRILRFTLDSTGSGAVGEPVVIAGDGNPCLPEALPCGDNGPATSAQVNPQGAALTDDGIVLSDAARLRKVYTSGPKNGTIETIAGTGVPGFSGDNGPAINAKIGSQVLGIVVGPDNNLYFSDTTNNRIRCIGCAGAGKISTYVGTGKAAGTDPGEVSAASPDGTPRRQANLLGPAGVTFDPQGRLVFAQGCDMLSALGPAMAGHPELMESYCDSTVRRVESNGRISTIAGISGQVADTTAGPANQRALRMPVGVSYRDDGTLFIAVLGNTLAQYLPTVMGGDLSGLLLLKPAIYCVGCKGGNTISRVAGGVTADKAARNGSRATSGMTATWSLDPKFSGDLYFADSRWGQIRRVRL